MSRLQNHAIYALLALAGAFAFGTIALNRGETVNAVWIVIAAVTTYLIAYRYHSLHLATRVAQLDPNRPTPALRLNDGLDYVPTNRYVLFGHHFAAIAGAGPLVGRFWRPRWVICRACSGSLSAWCLPARSRIS